MDVRHHLIAAFQIFSAKVHGGGDVALRHRNCLDASERGITMHSGPDWAANSSNRDEWSTVSGSKYPATAPLPANSRNSAQPNIFSRVSKFSSLPALYLTTAST